MKALKLGTLAAALTFGLSSSASAQLTIIRVDQGGTPPGNLAGGGNLDDLFNQACDWWEAVYCGDAHTVTLRYRWGALSPGVLGTHTLQAQSGNPNRETLGRLTFDNDGSTAFFADPTPESASEYTVYAPLERDLGGGLFNTARYYRNSTGAATNRIDLYSVVLHEVGHGLGLSSANVSYQQEIAGDNEIDVVAPQPLPGTKIPTTPGSAHLSVFRALMEPAATPSTRRIPAGVDVLTNAQLSRFGDALLVEPVRGSSAFRNGSGVNPTGFAETSPAIIGETWSTTVDLSNGAASSIVFLGLGGVGQASTKFGELLVSAPLFTASIAAGVHDSAIPVDCSFVGRQMPAQAATLGPPKAELHNALDLTVGAW